MAGALELFFNRGGVKVKNQVLSCNMTRWFSPHPSAHIRSYYLCHAVHKCRNVVSNVLMSDRWSLPLLWHLSDINAICNFWPQLQILERSASRAPANWPIIIMCLSCWRICTIHFIPIQCTLHTTHSWWFIK